MESILTSIKKLLGIEEEYEHFDGDIIVHINSAFSTLHQLGVGPDEGFSISSGAECWSDFSSDLKIVNLTKSYVYLKTRLIFDPPTNSFVIDSINGQLNDLTWRLNIAAETDCV